MSILSASQAREKFLVGWADSSQKLLWDLETLILDAFVFQSQDPNVGATNKDVAFVVVESAKRLTLLEDENARLRETIQALYAEKSILEG